MSLYEKLVKKEEKLSLVLYWKPYSKSEEVPAGRTTAPLIVADSSVISDASLKVGATKDFVVKDLTSPYW